MNSETVGKRKNIPPTEYLGLFKKLNRDGFDFVRFVGNGGGGVVFEVFSRQQQCTVALKALNHSTLGENSDLHTERRNRFEREIRNLQRLKDVASIATYYQCSVKGDFPYFTMELIDGPNFSQIMDLKKMLSVADASEVVRQCAATLCETWRTRIVHRDIKPSNLLLQELGVVTVVDWGISKSVRENNDKAITNPQQFIGTMDFVAPELISKTSKPTDRTDVYSLGCTCYYLLTGRTPFHDAIDKANAHQFTTPIPVNEIRPEISEDFSLLVDQMLEKNQGARPASAEVVKRVKEAANKHNLVGLYQDCYSIAESSLSQERRLGSPPEPTFESKKERLVVRKSASPVQPTWLAKLAKMAKRKAVPTWLPIVAGLILLVVACFCFWIVRSSKTTTIVFEDDLGSEAVSLDHRSDASGREEQREFVVETGGEVTPNESGNLDEWIVSVGGKLDSQIAHLQHANLSGKRDLSPLKEMKTLVEVNLQSAQLPEKGLNGIPRTVASLILNNSDVSDEHLASLQSTRIRSLLLWGCPITDKGMASLAKVSSLSYLAVPSKQITNEGFRFIKEMPNLSNICFQNAQLDDGIADVFAHTPRIIGINLDGTSVGHDTVLSISKHLPHLQQLQLVSTSITSETIAEIAKLRGLKNLSIKSCKRVSPEALKQLNNCTKLRELNISALNLENQDLLFLRQFENLEILHIGSNPFDETGLEMITSLPALRTLYINDMDNIDAATLAKARKTVQR